MFRVYLTLITILELFREPPLSSAQFLSTFNTQTLLLDCSRTIFEDGTVLITFLLHLRFYQMLTLK